MISLVSGVLLLSTVLTNTTISGDVKSKEFIIAQPNNLQSALIEYYYSDQQLSSDLEHRNLWNQTVSLCINQKHTILSPQLMISKNMDGLNVLSIELKSKRLDTSNKTLCHFQTEKKYLNYKIRFYFKYSTKIYETDWKQQLWLSQQQEVTNCSIMWKYVIGTLITILCFIISIFFIVFYNFIKK